MYRYICYVVSHHCVHFYIHQRKENNNNTINVNERKRKEAKNDSWQLANEENVSFSHSIALNTTPNRKIYTFQYNKKKYSNEIYIFKT